MPKEKSLMGWQVGLSLPAHLAFTDTVHVCGTSLYTTGRQISSLLGQAASPMGTEKINVSLHQPEELLALGEVPALFPDQGLLS